MTIANMTVIRLLRLLGHQEWIRYRARDLIISSLCNPNVIDPHDFEVDFFGLKYKGNLSCCLDWVVYFYGAYEKFELLLLRDLVKDKGSSVFIDIGANIGQHSLFMSQYCDRIHAFEPYEPVRRKLEFNIQHNGIRNIVVHNVGLGHKNCWLDYFAPKTRNSGTGSFVPSHSPGSNEHFGELQVVNADDYIAKLGLQNLNLIKIDVEGFERNVLTGIRDTLLEYRPYVVMEFSAETKRSFQGTDEMMSMLPRNYSIKRIQTYKRAHCVLFCKPGYDYVDFDFNVPCCDVIFSP